MTYKKVIFLFGLAIILSPIWAMASIVDSLEKNQITTITEKDFRSWATADDADNSVKSGGAGSGDIEDLKNYIIANQAVVGCHSVSTYDDWKNLVSPLEKIIPSPKFPKKQDAIQLLLMLYKKSPPPWNPSSNFDGNHSVIATYISEDINGVVRIDYLDPNGPSNGRSIYCNRGSDNVPYPLSFCYLPDYDEFVAIVIPQDYLQNQLNLSSVWNNAVSSNFCKDPNHRDYCQRNINQWIQNNYPKIDNNAFPGGGKCSGWTDFVLKVAYLGDFVGEDYHPGDGKFVGVACDTSHHKITQKSAGLNPVNWLGNVFSVWSKLWP